MPEQIPTCQEWQRRFFTLFDWFLQVVQTTRSILSWSYSALFKKAIDYLVRYNPRTDEQLAVFGTLLKRSGGNVNVPLVSRQGDTLLMVSVVQSVLFHSVGVP
jgi:hypothetical protein